MSGANPYEEENDGRQRTDESSPQNAAIMFRAEDRRDIDYETSVVN